jgi:hypothetical protein
MCAHVAPSSVGLPCARHVKLARYMDNIENSRNTAWPVTIGVEIARLSQVGAGTNHNDIKKFNQNMGLERIYGVF